MSAPLVVNTRDGVCWTRRAVTSGGIALYAPEAVRTCPEFVMATIDELAEHGIVGSADALPMPVREEPQEDPVAAGRRLDLLSLMDEHAASVVSPVLAAVLDEAERLRARVAELEAAPVLVCRECAAPVRWVENTNGGWWNHTRPASARHGVVPKPAEDPCHPCGCPKRFDRHAWGCTTLPAEDDVTGFFQPGHAYTHRPGPDDLGGPRLRFYCESVTTDKATGQPVARGWGGRRYGDRWTSVQQARGLEDWQSGAWADTTTGGDV